MSTASAIRRADRASHSQGKRRASATLPPLPDLPPGIARKQRPSPAAPHHRLQRVPLPVAERARKVGRSRSSLPPLPPGKGRCEAARGGAKLAQKGGQPTSAERAPASGGASAEEEIRIGSTLAGRYEITGLIGRGGMATVFEARCNRLDRPFAIKVMRRDLGERVSAGNQLVNEALSLRKLDHPSCVALCDWGQTPSGAVYLVMEYVRGMPLSEFLGQPLPASRALEIVRQVLDVLDHAHAAGIVHRDVKPENVMLVSTDSRQPVVKVLDFGLARWASGDGPPRPLAERLSAKYVMGTPTYMAPEVIRGESADARSDLYAVGAMLFYLLTGRRPFSAESALDVLRSKIDGPAPRLEDVAPGLFSAELDAVVARALARDPADRFASGAEFLAALADVQRTPGGGLSTGPSSSAMRSLRRAARAVSGSLRRLVVTPESGELAGDLP